jgi:hypothetical protein
VTKNTEKELTQSKGREVSLSRNELMGVASDLEATSEIAVEAGIEQLDAGEETLAAAREAAAVGRMPCSCLIGRPF